MQADERAAHQECEHVVGTNGCGELLLRCAHADAIHAILQQEQDDAVRSTGIGMETVPIFLNLRSHPVASSECSVAECQSWPPRVAVRYLHRHHQVVYCEEDEHEKI